MTGFVVCGSRAWPQDKLWFVTAKMIEIVPIGAMVITGGAAGVDRHADDEAFRLRYRTQVIKPDWERHGKRAGFLRNLEMLDECPVAVLAFQYQASRGTQHTIVNARQRGIKVHVFTEEDWRPDIGALDQDYEPITRWPR